MGIALYKNDKIALASSSFRFEILGVHLNRKIDKTPEH
jgi:hypothetical protein